MQRNDRHRDQNGPLSKDEILTVFERGFNLSSRRFIATQWALDPEKSSAEDIVHQLNDKNLVAQKLDQLTRLQRLTLSHFAASGGRLRGENLRKDLLLRGFGNKTEIMRELVQHCILIPLPTPGQAELDIEEVIENEQFLQHDLAVCAVVQETLHKEAESMGPAALKSWQGDVTPANITSTDTLELNLLHLNTLLSHDKLRLNKSGVPNRRSLVNFARGITMPGSHSEAGNDLDLTRPLHLDYLTFLLALSLELGFATQTDHIITSDYQAMVGYFQADEKARNRSLFMALQNIKYWSESQSFALHRNDDNTPNHDDQFSQLSPGGEALIGARGYVLSVIKRARVDGWTEIASLVDLGLSLDRNYLERSLKKGAPLAEPQNYVEAVVTRALVWMGFIEKGKASDTHAEVARFTPRGIRALNMSYTSADGAPAEIPKQAQGCLIAQPNFEIMTFLDAAPLDVLFKLYQVGERTKLSDRVATFLLTAKSVQRGFTMDTTAEEIVALLTSASHIPVPDNIGFQINDWERVHHQMQLYANGMIMRHSDPEQLDLALGQLLHELRESAPDVVRLSADTAFVVAPDNALLTPFIERNKAFDINYLGEIPPCLRFVDPLVIMVDPMQCDFITHHELPLVATLLDDESNEEAHFYELNIKAIKARWPYNTLQAIVDFLEPRVIDGLPTGQLIKLQAELTSPMSVDIMQGISVVVLQSKQDGDRVAAMQDCQPFIAKRLDDRVFALFTGHESEFEETLAEYGIIIEKPTL